MMILVFWAAKARVKGHLIVNIVGASEYEVTSLSIKRIRSKIHVTPRKEDGITAINSEKLKEKDGLDQRK